MQEDRKGNDVRKQQRGLQHHQGSHQDPQLKLAAIEDSSGNGLTLNTDVINPCTEYCSGLYNHEHHPNFSLLQSNQTSTREAESLPVLREEVEEAVRSLKAGRTTFPLSCLRMEATQQ